MKLMVESCLDDAVMYELWLSSDSKSALKIYYSDIPWPTGTILYYKQVHNVKQLLGITSDNAERRQEEETSVLRSKLLAHANLVHYAENFKVEHVDATSSVPQTDRIIISSFKARPFILAGARSSFLTRELHNLKIRACDNDDGGSLHRKMNETKNHDDPHHVRTTEGGGKPIGSSKVTTG